MSQSATAPESPPRAPVEEPLLARYSPHHELPLSTATSVALHALVIGLLLIAGLVIARLNWGSVPAPPTVTVVTMDRSGGGDAGDGGADAVEDLPARGPEVPPAPANAPRPELQGPAAGPKPPVLPGENQRLIADAEKQVEASRRVGDKVRAKLAGIPGRRNNVPGVGPGNDGGKAATARQLRWTLIFNTKDGKDYARQLEAFGAILAIPDPENADAYLVISDLSRRPAEPKPEDVTKIERIYWIDDKPASVQSLAAALGLRPPSHFVVFFPAELEEKLLRLELSFRGKKENEITETRFGVRRAFVGYEPYVVDQR